MKFNSVYKVKFRPATGPSLLWCLLAALFYVERFSPKTNELKR